MSPLAADCTFISPSDRDGRPMIRRELHPLRRSKTHDYDGHRRAPARSPRMATLG